MAPARNSIVRDVKWRQPRCVHCSLQTVRQLRRPIKEVHDSGSCKS